jgi:hypothetical protein
MTSKGAAVVGIIADGSEIVGVGATQTMECTRIAHIGLAAWLAGTVDTLFLLLENRGVVYSSVQEKVRQ